MRFYDRKLQEYANRDDIAAFEERRVNKRSKKMYDKYQAQLKGLIPRIGTKSYLFLSSRPHLIFDANLLNCSLGDWKGVGLNFKRRCSLHLLDFDTKWLYELKYSGIAAFAMNLPLEKWFDERGCGSLLWNEFTSKSNEILSHEFLFTTGLEIKLDFAKFSWERKRIDGHKPIDLRYMVKGK